eukprot:2825864-Pyramimonas_sp.AAC.1
MRVLAFLLLVCACACVIVILLLVRVVACPSVLRRRPCPRVQPVIAVAVADGCDDFGAGAPK